MQIPDEQIPFEENIQKNPFKKPTRTQAEKKKDRAFEKENEPKITIPQKQSRTGRTIKPIAKMQKSNIIIYIFMTQLSTLLNDWEQDVKVSTFLTSCCDQDQELAHEDLKNKEDQLHILATSMPKANTASPVEFSSLSQFDIKERKTYKQVINGPHA